MSVSEALILILSLTMAINVTTVIRGQPLIRVDESVKDSVKFYVYTRQNPAIPEPLEVDVESVVRNVINPAKPTTLAIHNTKADKNAEEYTLIRDTKLQLEDGNIVIVDYSDLIEDYSDVATSVLLAPHIADAIADLLVLLHDYFNLDFQQLHMVGVALGGQLCGLVGQNVYNRVNEKPQRITALDPTGRLFNASTPINERLSPDDAEFVEVVHTNAGRVGFLTPCGHVDYYPNGGQLQPGCEEDNLICSHLRSYLFIPEMWLPLENHEMLLLKCSAIEYLGLDNCRWTTERMGDLTHQVRDGMYYLETNAVQPFGKGAFAAAFL